MDLQTGAENTHYHHLIGFCLINACAGACAGEVSPGTVLPCSACSGAARGAPVSFADRPRIMECIPFDLWLRKLGLLDAIKARGADGLAPPGQAHSRDSVSSKSLASPRRRREL